MLNMKIKDYIERLNRLAELYPDAELVYSCDDEGNHYSEVLFHPSCGEVKDDEWNPCLETAENVKHICLN
jgi:hypothetical protein